ncbi:GTPase, G3E family [Actinobaculum suis]|uniref:ABC transporter n=1 Tax=Actinobaculum suis TaxID=1657 RepID=A0A0K9EUB0_9ACTO|nr:GTP-binding protein [Actinobaculum suis]KMY23455.1 hypothetical protein ACU19_04135 [Actinobaculum suis]MDY5154072.1 GTP-binding protein [Actinobaculum suis]SDE51018.1 GTPase, G3E family [Actinobaculum suis]VDG76995.1 ABC transporter [Actinobaculum suis]
MSANPSGSAGRQRRAAASKIERAQGQWNATVPVVFVCGMGETELAQTSTRAQLLMPEAVVVRYHLDAERELLVRSIIELTGVLDETERFLEHGCVACTVRADISGVLEELARLGNWPAIIVEMPPTIEAVPLCYSLMAEPQAAPHVRIGSVVVAVAGPRVLEDALGYNLLAEEYPEERFGHDERGVAEVVTALVEGADVIDVHGSLSTGAKELLEILSRPDAVIHAPLDTADAATPLALMPEVLTDGFNSEATENWLEFGNGEYGEACSGEIWTLRLESERPFHPQRLLRNLASLAHWQVRARGNFWLPTRHGQIGYWDGVGGGLAIGMGSTTQAPYTRLQFVGRGPGREEIKQVFTETLLTDTEMDVCGTSWDVNEDGFETWLGPVTGSEEPNTGSGD